MGTQPEIIYDLHDSTIVAVSTGPRREVSFVVDLYPIFYPDKPRIILSFGGIFNFEKVCEYAKGIEAEADDEYIGCRIDDFHADTKKVSRTGDYWYFFATDWLGPLRIHCSSMTMNQIKNAE